MIGLMDYIATNNYRYVLQGEVLQFGETEMPFSHHYSKVYLPGEVTLDSARGKTQKDNCGQTKIFNNAKQSF